MNQGQLDVGLSHSDSSTAANHELVWAAAETGGFGFGGFWFTWVVRPLFSILLLAWLWRLILAILLSARLARLDLSLAPTPPDGAAGLVPFLAPLLPWLCASSPSPNSAPSSNTARSSPNTEGSSESARSNTHPSGATLAGPAIMDPVSELASTSRGDRRQDEGKAIHGRADHRDPERS